jgi:hypothetical protein
VRTECTFSQQDMKVTPVCGVPRLNRRRRTDPALRQREKLYAITLNPFSDSLNAL